MATPDRSGSAATPIPWLSGLLFVACAIFSIHARLQHEVVEREGRAALDAAREYFLEHPYLEPGPVLEAQLPSKVIARAQNDFENQRLARGSLETPPRVQHRQQARLEEIVETAVAGVRALPARGVAVVPAEGFALAWLVYPLLHESHWHLLGNGLLLLFLGIYLERAVGLIGFVLVAVLASLAGAAAWTAALPDQARYGLVGASPLAAGLLAVFAVRHVGQRGEGFYVSGLVVGVLWLALPAWAGNHWSFAEVELVGRGAPPAATTLYWALLAAAACGLVATLVLSLVPVDATPIAAGASEVTRHPQFRRAMRARHAGRLREALEALTDFVREDPDAYEAALALWEVARDLGRGPEASSALLRVIRIELKRELPVAAIAHWLELIETGVPQKADPALLIRMALLLRAQDRREEAVDALRCALERSGDRDSHVIAARVARAARGLDTEIAVAAAWRALGSIELLFSERQALETLLAEVLPPPKELVAQARANAQPPVLRPAPRDSADPTSQGGRPKAIEVETRNRMVDAIIAVPLEIGEEGIEIQTKQGQKKLVRYRRIEAVAVAAVHGLGPKPVILVDLVVNWMTTTHETLRVIRVRGDQFDPRSLFASTTSALEALRSFVKLVIERSRATPLPDENTALGRPFTVFNDLASYQRTILLVEGTARQSD